MPKLPRHSQYVRGGEKYIGAKLPQYLSDYLHLYCVAEGIPKTDVFRALLRQWYQENIATTPESTLIKKVVQTCLILWNHEKKFKGASFEIFCENIEAELKNKNVHRIAVETIMRKIKNGAY